MLRFFKGDMLKAEAEALVNTVNTVGVMGKGIALQFKEAFPNNNKMYVEACKRNQLQPGQLLAVWDNNLLLGKKLIVNFATKKHWRHPSKYEYIERGLSELPKLLEAEGVRSVAIPPLGCGNGGLDWQRVKQLIIEHLQGVDADILVYEPNAEIKSILQREEVKKAVKLTPARAQLLFALFVYESFGESSSLFAANKLAYLLQRMGQPLRLQFQRHNYGPYAIGVEKVLYTMNGIYLKGLEQQQTRPFEALHLNYEKWPEVKEFIDKSLSQEDKKRTMNLVQLVTGFTSELSLEILASVAMILDSAPNLSFDNVKEQIKSWSKRKEELFKDEYTRVAYDHLLKYRNSAF